MYFGTKESCGQTNRRWVLHMSKYTSEYTAVYK